MVVKITNGKLILDKIVNTDLYYQEGVITAIGDFPHPYDKVIDAGGSYIAPGFIDIHNHGGDGFEFEDGTEEAVQRSAEFHYLHGTTTLFPTLSAADIPQVMLGLETIKNVMKTERSSIAGVHLEGPYLSPAQTGAQDETCIKEPQVMEYGAILAKYGDIIKRWTYAPEIPGSEAFQETMNMRGIVTSAGHTNADFDAYYKAYKKGCKLITHLYSCTSTITRSGGFRKMGVIESSFLLEDVNVEIIADGCHLPPELIKMIYRVKGSDHVCLVTDCIRFGGYTSDQPIMGGTENVPYIIEDGVAKLLDRSAFAGSIATADVLVRTVVNKAGIDLCDAVKMMTEVPARIMGLTKKGKLKVGCDADIVIFDEDINIKEVIS